MRSFKKILVPTDFSENASVAYHPAQQLASQFGATVDFMHVIPTMQYFHESMRTLGIPLDVKEDLYPHIQEESITKINALMDEYLEPENRGEGIVELAPKPSKMIVDHAEKYNYDLILLATHGQHQTELLRGSVTEKIIRYSSVPVLSTNTSSFEDLMQILVPTDGSQISFRALSLATVLALMYRADITLFHVQELYGNLADNAKKNPLKSGEENLQDLIFLKLENFVHEENNHLFLRKGADKESQLVYTDEHTSATINIHTVIGRGVSAHYAITEYAKENADIVVMTTHGHSGLSHLLLGSTAEKVARHLELPVLTVKPDLGHE